MSHYMNQICSGITSGRVLNGELCAQRLQKSNSAFAYRLFHMKLSLQSSERNVVYIYYILHFALMIEEKSL